MVPKEGGAEPNRTELNQIKPNHIATVTFGSYHNIPYENKKKRFNTNTAPLEHAGSKRVPDKDL